MGRDERAEAQQPLIPGGSPPGAAPGFQNARPPRDRVWALLWALGVAIVAAGGVYAYAHR